MGANVYGIFFSGGTIFRRRRAAILDSLPQTAQAALCFWRISRSASRRRLSSRTPRRNFRGNPPIASAAHRVGPQSSPPKFVSAFGHITTSAPATGVVPKEKKRNARFPAPRTRQELMAHVVTRAISLPPAPSPRSCPQQSTIVARGLSTGGTARVTRPPTVSREASRGLIALEAAPRKLPLFSALEKSPPPISGKRKRNMALAALP